MTIDAIGVKCTFTLGWAHLCWVLWDWLVEVASLWRCWMLFWRLAALNLASVIAPLAGRAAFQVNASACPRAPIMHPMLVLSQAMQHKVIFLPCAHPRIVLDAYMVD